MTPVEQAWLQDECRKLQDGMLAFSRGGLPESEMFDGTLRGLIYAYQTDTDSTYHKLRYHTRIRRDQLLRKLSETLGLTPLSDIKARLIIAWHKGWTDAGKKNPMGAAYIGALRTLMSFGATILEDAECERLCGVLHKMRFPSAGVGKQRMTAEQANLIRAKAHELGKPSIALAQAFQFELMLRQRDVIGEWVPLSEPGTSDVTGPSGKWLRGLRWNEIDQDLILRHTTSKTQADFEIDLKLAPMVMDELLKLAERDPSPKSGPIVICEATKRPWIDSEYRRKWRAVARAAGIPDAVCNMHSRAGGISEATDAGAELELVRHAATHSSVTMTARYSRGSAEKVANVMQIRSAHRKKRGKDE